MNTIDLSRYDVNFRLTTEASRETALQQVEQVNFLLIPGRGRSVDGMDISPKTIDRVNTAVEFFKYYGLGDRGFIVCSGYKTPGDKAGEPWSDGQGGEYEGVPEAYGMRKHLLKQGIDDDSIIVEPDSIDTVTNFTNSQKLIPEGQDVVGIVAQRAHLMRMMKVIAPRTLTATALGIAVGEKPGEEDIDTLQADIFSRMVSFHLKPGAEYNDDIAMRRATRLWKLMLAIKPEANALQPLPSEA